MTELTVSGRACGPFQRLLITYLTDVGDYRMDSERKPPARDATFPIVGIASCGYLLIVGSSDAAARSRTFCKA